MDLWVTDGPSGNRRTFRQQMDLQATDGPSGDRWTVGQQTDNGSPWRSKAWEHVAMAAPPNGTADRDRRIAVAELVLDV
jgi:hypothetical protein